MNKLLNISQELLALSTNQPKPCDDKKGHILDRDGANLLIMNQMEEPHR